jgi:hypothetical protein
MTQDPMHEPVRRKVKEELVRRGYEIADSVVDEQVAKYVREGREQLVAAGRSMAVHLRSGQTIYLEKVKIFEGKNLVDGTSAPTVEASDWMNIETDSGLTTFIDRREVVAMQFSLDWPVPAREIQQLGFKVPKQ